MQPCLLCEIANGTHHVNIIREDAATVSFLDPNPDTDGHVVVMPRGHDATILELSKENYDAWVHALRETARIMTDTLHPGGFTIGWNHGPAAGQLTPHLHAHILPRTTGDGGGTIHSVIRRLARPVEEIAALFEH